ncbi:hypothetical protein QQ045_018419 [Rhodiola kirilowii]
MAYNYVMRYLPLYRAAVINDWETAEAIFNQDPDADTAMITYWWETTLHIAVGTNSSHRFVDKNTKAAKDLVEKDAEMALIANQYGNTAVKLAAWYGRKETLVYLLGVTPDETGEDGMGPYSGLAGGDLITLTITAGFYDVAMKLITEYPKLVTEKDRNGFTALQTLATQPSAFPSGRWFWQYNIHDTKLKQKQTDQLMNVMITTILNVGEHSVAWDVLGTALSTAAKHRIHELIEECLGRYPGLIWYKIEGLYLFLAAIKNRQVKVYNLLYQMTGHVVFAATNTIGEDNALHLVGRKATQHTLSTVTGAALQMQRELQWFKEVEKFVEPSYKEALNAEKKTPRMVFIDEHKDLVEKGEKWMKDTASSSTLVAALIVTVSFASIFTAPGGNKDNGTAYFLRDSTFILFVISHAVALFSSVTSVLMFLAMLTSRYAEDDFLYALPKRITLGLVSLFISIASIMVTFCAAIALVLREQFAWIAIPVGLIACVPVTLFALLQFPLLVELVLSTYGPSIFHKQNNLILH